MEGVSLLKISVNLDVNLPDCLEVILRVSFKQNFLLFHFHVRKTKKTMSIKIVQNSPKMVQSDPKLVRNSSKRLRHRPCTKNTVARNLLRVFVFLSKSETKKEKSTN